MAERISMAKHSLFGRSVSRWLPLHTFINALEHYIDVDCFLVPIQDPWFWMEIHRAKRGSINTDLVYWTSSAEKRSSSYMENLKKLALKGKPLVVDLGGVSELLVPVMDKGRVQAALIVGPFASHVLSDKELKNFWVSSSGNQDVTFGYEYNYFCRTLLGIPLLQGRTLDHFLEFVGLFAKALSGESKQEALNGKMRDIFEKNITRSFFHADWAERITHQDRLYQFFWKDGVVTPWEKTEMGISFIPDRVLAFVPSLENERSSTDIKRRILRLQAVALEFVAKLTDVTAARLEDYGVLLIHAPGPSGAENTVAAVHLAHTFKRHIEKAMNCDVFCGIGARKAMNQLCDSYQGAVDAVHHAVEVGKWLVVFSDETVSKPEFWDISILANRISAALLSGKRDTSVSDLTKYISMARQLSSGRLEVLRFQFIYLVQNLLQEAERTFRVDIAMARSIGVHWNEILGVPSHTNDLVAALHTCMEEAVPIFDQPNGSSREVRFLKAQKWVEANYHRDPGLSEVAKIYGFSAIGFRRELKREKGLTYSQWLSQLRLSKVMELLSNTRLSANAVATAVGFSSTSYFFQWFKQQTKSTPETWRRRMKMP